jgi:hypothetical protein
MGRIANWIAKRKGRKLRELQESTEYKREEQIKRLERARWNLRKNGAPLHAVEEVEKKLAALEAEKPTKLRRRRVRKCSRMVLEPVREEAVERPVSDDRQQPSQHKGEPGSREIDPVPVAHERVEENTPMPKQSTGTGTGYSPVVAAKKNARPAMYGTIAAAIAFVRAWSPDWLPPPENDAQLIAAILGLYAALRAVWITAMDAKKAWWDRLPSRK